MRESNIKIIERQERMIYSNLAVIFSNFIIAAGLWVAYAFDRLPNIDPWNHIIGITIVDILLWIAFCKMQTSEVKRNG